MTNERFFIYFRHTPKGLKFLPSFDLSPMGRSKQLITKADPASRQVSAVLDEIIRAVKVDLGGFNHRNRPDFKQVVAIINPRLRARGLIKEDVVHIPEMGQFGERLFVKTLTP